MSESGRRDIIVTVQESHPPESMATTGHDVPDEIAITSKKRSASQSELTTLEPQAASYGDEPVGSDILDEKKPAPVRGRRKAIGRGRGIARGARSGKGRGRPAKKPRPVKVISDDSSEDESDDEFIAASKSKPQATPGKKRGRPVKTEINLNDSSDPVEAENDEDFSPETVVSKARPETTPGKKRGRVIKTVATEDFPIIPPEEPRRSGRSRAAPKDAYMEALELEESRPKPSKAKVTLSGTGRGRARKKKIAIEEMFTPENLSSRNSPWIDKIDLSAVFSKDFMENRLTEEQKAKIISWLPECDLVYPYAEEGDDDAIHKPDPSPQIDHNIWKNPIFKDALANWTNDLAQGKYEPDYIERGRIARQRRMAGEFDDWKDKQFESFWGQKQKFYHDAVAGESSTVKLHHLVKYHVFKLGDVFSMRRSFVGGYNIRKDAVLISTDPQTHTMTFSYPPGSHEWEKQGVENKTVENVFSLTQFENLLIKENGSYPFKIPNGNAFKTIRIIRKGEDIGCVFDVRAKFWHQYLEDPGDKVLDKTPTQESEI